jgi:sulfatase modifying factor 1
LADIFISYKKEDRDRAAHFARCFVDEGFSVWWDDNISPVMAWDKAIEEQISSAAAVVVLWSPRAVASDWVRTEALYAQERGMLVPALIETCELPLAFKLNQTVDLSVWNGDRTDRHWRKLLTWVADLRASRLAGGVAAFSAAAPVNPFRDVIGRLPSGEPVVVGSFINLATPAGTLFQDTADAPIMRVLPQGEFLLGAAADDPDRTPVEYPQRRIQIPVPFAMSIYQITRGNYESRSGAAAVQSSPLSGKGRLSSWLGRTATPDAPAQQQDPACAVNCVSFDDAFAFAQSLCAATGQAYRLPSEAEWEYACRAGSRTRFSCGDAISSAHAVFHYEDGAAPSAPSAPGRFAPNDFGLFDMHGNVREWTADMWHESYDVTPTDGRPATGGHGSMRVVRGGGWSDPPRLLRSSARSRATQTVRSEAIGFRLVRNLA